jgi:predicted Zn finger-like uncharacterized protein
MFKVVPDQLRVSDGWVRCGQCDEVFNANAHLQSLEDAPAPFPIEQPFQDPISWGESVEVDSAEPQPDIPLDFPEGRDARDAYVDPLLEVDVLEDVTPSGVVSAPVHEEAPSESDPLDAVPADDLGASMPGMDETMVSPHSDWQPDAASIPTPQFLNSAHEASRPQSRSARAIVSMLCVLSACLLLGQWMVHERDRIAATEPATLVVLDPLCRVLDCTIAPLRQIESVVIDSSSFGKTQADVYRLGFAIKSTALVDVALPSLELTLTDAQDKAVVRRVFSPQDVGAQRPSLVSGSEWTGSVPVTVKQPAGAERIAGYRLLAFYP